VKAAKTDVVTDALLALDAIGLAAVAAAAAAVAAVAAVAAALVVTAVGRTCRIHLCQNRICTILRHFVRWLKPRERHGGSIVVLLSRCWAKSLTQTSMTECGHAQIMS